MATDTDTIREAEDEENNAKLVQDEVQLQNQVKLEKCEGEAEE
jgi:hypothetical protein